MHEKYERKFVVLNIQDLEQHDSNANIFNKNNRHLLPETFARSYMKCSLYTYVETPQPDSGSCWAGAHFSDRNTATDNGD